MFIPLREDRCSDEIVLFKIIASTARPIYVMPFFGRYDNITKLLWNFLIKEVSNWD